MQVLLKNYKEFGALGGKWAEVDTTSLHTDCYTVVLPDGKRQVNDEDIKAVRDDARPGRGRCKCCGAIVQKGMESAHFEERESKPCEACFSYRTKEEVNRQPIGEPVTEEKDGKTTTTQLYEKVTTSWKVCTATECHKKHCRNMGIQWFTPKNTFFMAYPDGCPSLPFYREILTYNKGFTNEHPPHLWYEDKPHNYTYKKLLGSYWLTLCLDEKGEQLQAFYLQNSRVRLYFLPLHKDGGPEFIVWERRNRPKTCSNLYKMGLPTSVVTQLEKIIDEYERIATRYQLKSA